MICFKERIKVKGKFQLQTKITKSAEETLKKAAVLKNDC